MCVASRSLQDVARRKKERQADTPDRENKKPTVREFDRYVDTIGARKESATYPWTVSHTEKLLT